MDALPEWPAGTVAVLATGAGEPHAIPVSTAVRRGPRTIVLALALSRGSLARLREDPRCALTVLAAGNIAFTAFGRAAVVDEGERVAAVRVDVERIQDHRRDTFVIDDGVRWHWTDAAAERADAEVRRRLRTPTRRSRRGPPKSPGRSTVSLRRIASVSVVALAAALVAAGSSDAAKPADTASAKLRRAVTADAIVAHNRVLETIGTRSRASSRASRSAASWRTAS